MRKDVKARFLRCKTIEEAKVLLRRLKQEPGWDRPPLHPLDDDIRAHFLKLRSAAGLSPDPFARSNPVLRRNMSFPKIVDGIQFDSMEELIEYKRAMAGMPAKPPAPEKKKPARAAAPPKKEKKARTPRRREVEVKDPNAPVSYKQAMTLTRLLGERKHWAPRYVGVEVRNQVLFNEMGLNMGLASSLITELQQVETYAEAFELFTSMTGVPLPYGGASSNPARRNSGWPWMNPSYRGGWPWMG